VSNNPYLLTRAGGFGYRPSIATGQLGIATASATGRLRWSQWNAPSFEVESGTPVPVGVDGEALVLDPPLRFTMRPGALRVRLPTQAFGYSPAARRSSSAWSAITDLLTLAFGRHAGAPRTPG